ncbi:MAG: hypothetical protein JWN18_605 [Parcubacteria group bacterium]|nr:hypothetical protein [Parcubacteria group bacterium]
MSNSFEKGTAMGEPTDPDLLRQAEILKRHGQPLRGFNAPLLDKELPTVRDYTRPSKGDPLTELLGSEAAARAARRQAEILARNAPKD